MRINIVNYLSIFSLKKYIANIFNYLLNNFFYIIIKSIYFGTLIN